MTDKSVPEILRGLLHEMRQKCKQNATFGSSDERQAWSGMADLCSQARVLVGAGETKEMGWSPAEWSAKRQVTAITANPDAALHRVAKAIAMKSEGWEKNWTDYIEHAQAAIDAMP